MELIIKLNENEASEAMQAGTLQELVASVVAYEYKQCTEDTETPSAPVMAAKPVYAVPQAAHAPEVPAAPAPAVPAQPVPTAAPAFSRDQLALAATQLMDQGKMPELQKVLAAMGVKALTELSEERFEAFAAAIRELGAKI